MSVNIGRRIYYDVQTGERILETSEVSGAAIVLTIEEDIAIYKPLSERQRDSFDVLELEYGDYKEDFASNVGYRVDLETKKLQFKYPDPTEPGTEQPFVTPFSEEISILKESNATLFYESMINGLKTKEMEDVQSTLAYESVMKDIKISEQESARAELIYTLMMNGGI